MVQNRWVRTEVIVNIAVLMLGSSSVRAADASEDSGEAVPGGDTRLTRTELRWCTFEALRLEGASAEIRSYEAWEVDGSNADLADYNRLCSNKPYRLRDMATVESELSVDKRRTLRQAGIYRVRRARAERNARRMFVKADAADIRSEPSNAGREIGRVQRWGELIATGRKSGQWHEIEWITPSLPTVLQFGWVLGGFVEQGSGANARFEYCEAHAGQRARHNEIVRGKTEATIRNSLSIRNGTGKDAYIKMINIRGAVTVGFLADSGKTAKIEGVPPGSYEVLFATGSLFSRGCDSFSRRGAASRFEKRVDYVHSGQGWELTLHSVTDGNVRAQNMSYDDFDRL